jgi:D-aminopeptidase
VGQELGRYYLREELTREADKQPAAADGSIIIVIATDAPVDARNLKRMAARAMLGLARTGGSGSNGSGDYAIAFSTAAEVRVRPVSQNERAIPRSVKTLANDAMSPLFLAVVEATEEAIYNSLFKATTVTGKGQTVEALPLDRTLEILRKHGLISSPR